LCRIDLETGEWVEQACEVAFGEVAFAPRTGGTDPLDGYYLAFGTGLDDGRSGLVVWDAATFPGPPRARVLTPQRIPNGLHGNWSLRSLMRRFVFPVALLVALSTSVPAVAATAQPRDRCSTLTPIVVTALDGLFWRCSGTDNALHVVTGSW
jgi:hypothetical protein